MLKDKNIKIKVTKSQMMEESKCIKVKRNFKQFKLHLVGMGWLG